MKQIFRYFLQGLLLTAPAGLTIFIVYVIFERIDEPIRNYFYELFHLRIPGIGLVIVFLVITLLGLAGQTFILRPIRHMLEKFLKRVPVIKLIYTSLNDFLSALVGEKKRFTRPVLVRVNLISNLEKMGFVTTSDLSDLKIKDKVVVYFPHSYNFSGEMFIVPSEHITPLDIPPAEAMKFIVTAGITRV
ncbi:MAG: DUF502 domain-containing protein [Bacteroidales bacterium]|nr:DUF502 domain-containing protein [Bacteroidales bacterium]